MSQKLTLLEFLDRWLERRAQNPRPTRDIRQFIGAMFLLGYYGMVFRFAQHNIPDGNVDLIRDAMLTLGPPVGLIVGAMFRSDAREEQATRNTGEIIKTARDLAAANNPGGGGSGADNTIRDGDKLILNKTGAGGETLGDMPPADGPLNDEGK